MLGSVGRQWQKAGASLSSRRWYRASLELQEITTLTVRISNSLSERSGSLVPVLQTFAKYGLNLSHMESKLHQYSFGDASFEFELEAGLADESTQQCIADLRDLASVTKVSHVPPRSVPWFPTSLRELDDARTTLDGGSGLISEDHPGFSDQAYRQRRDEIVDNARKHTFGQPIPIVDYSEQENATWATVYERLQSLQKSYACDDFLKAMAKFNKHGVLTKDRVPQLADVSELLQGTTGFQVRPVMGLLTARDFLNSLAFRVFWSTQYIRHHANPFYTPEPDVCHELLGHVPLFAQPDFADFSQTIGLASLGATDEQIDRLSTLYWFTVEFGLLQEPNGAYKAYGAGVLSSFGELEWACSPSPSHECREMGGLLSHEATKDLLRPKIQPLQGAVTSQTSFPITTYQPQYFASPSLVDAKIEVMQFCDTLNRPFFCCYDPFSQRIKVTRSIERSDATSTADMQASKQADYFENLKKSDF